KADGIRCLFLATVNQAGTPESYLIDRKNDYYFLHLGLPHPEHVRHWQHETILDGELVLDIEPDGSQTLWFLLFDCVIFMGKSLIERPYTKRLGYLKDHVMKPYKKRLERDQRFAASQPFKMNLKPLELSYGLDKVFASMSKLKHKSDGIIFTSSVAPYGIGTCEKMLKWKPSDENTVDFRVSVRGSRDNPLFMLEIWLGQGEYKDFGEIHLDEDTLDEWKHSDQNGRIVECRYDPNWPGNWRFSRYRDDKETANHISTYEKIMESIRDNVDADTLKSAAPVIREQWKQRERAEAEGNGHQHH
ncbi:Dcp1p-Dcp2p decapping enzyme complex alpha subunit, partial [Blyttiomyces sp. JEL0837]